MKYFLFLFLSISMIAQKREITFNLNFNNTKKSSIIRIKEEKKILSVEYKLIDSISSAIKKDKKYKSDFIPSKLYFRKTKRICDFKWKLV